MSSEGEKGITESVRYAVSGPRFPNRGSLPAVDHAAQAQEWMSFLIKFFFGGKYLARPCHSHMPETVLFWAACVCVQVRVFACDILPVAGRESIPIPSTQLASTAQRWIALTTAVSLFVLERNY